MYNFFDNFLGIESVIYDLQFGFRQKYSTYHPLINLTDKMREQLDSKHLAYRILIDLQKASDTVDHDIFKQKLNHYGIRVVASYWFSSYLQNRSQYISINGFDSKLENIHFVVPQDSIL